MSGQIYQTLLEDLDKGEEVALITKYNLETKEIEKWYVFWNSWL